MSCSRCLCRLSYVCYVLAFLPQRTTPRPIRPRMHSALLYDDIYRRLYYICLIQYTLYLPQHSRCKPSDSSNHLLGFGLCRMDVLVCIMMKRRPPASLKLNSSECNYSHNVPLSGGSII